MKREFQGNEFYVSPSGGKLNIKCKLFLVGEKIELWHNIQIFYCSIPKLIW